MGHHFVHVSAACRQSANFTANRMHNIQHADRAGLQVEPKQTRSQAGVQRRTKTPRDRFTIATLKTVESWPEVP